MKGIGLSDADHSACTKFGEEFTYHPDPRRFNSCLCQIHNLEVGMPVENLYTVRYGHAEGYLEETALDYESAMKRLEELKTAQVVCKGSTIAFPVRYICVTNIITNISMTWRSKESMEFNGVI